MSQQERLLYLIQYLIKENAKYSRLKIPRSTEEQKRLFRSLMNVRPPEPVTDEFLKIQDAYLIEERDRKGVVSVSELSPIQEGICLWRGDITTLQADAIVNAANRSLLGCFIPCHRCIDNAIHSASGVQLRLACQHIMEEQGRDEPAGAAKITEAYNLPCRYVLHTVGPIVQGEPTETDRTLLASCYQSCLELAADSGLKNIAFCCISTGEFHFPGKEAAKIAVETVKGFLRADSRIQRVVFNVYKDTDFQIYMELLGGYQCSH
ncbi:protein-ADP-ribose hydrolase [Qiania dongpingensis]|uniref:Protein-ADP-ribose hydrolase n=1 Tax=Qiania dongpingensis TaxID=2763669 RepID=A0A7G9G2X6_9FIRM|nr:protein-ADP-ribose hydrolase [Qiania dongpingensis]QNM05158.1 protein-ADP-ribose hydrolase [Qiania dongpingensis]